MNKRPDFIPREVFREYMPASRINKYMRIGGITAHGYVGRCEKLGRPLKYKLNQGSKYYRPIDLMARAFSDGLEITDPYDESSLPSGVPPRPRIVAAQAKLEVVKTERDVLLALRAEYEDMVKEIQELRDMMLYHQASMSLTGVTLLRAKEIVSGSIPITSYKTKFSGIYFLIDNGKIIYIGQSVNVFARVMAHVGYKKFDSFSFVTCSVDKLDALESLYIHMLRPKDNGKYVNGTPMAPLKLEDLLASNPGSFPDINQSTPSA